MMIDEELKNMNLLIDVHKESQESLGKSRLRSTSYRRRYLGVGTLDPVCKEVVPRSGIQSNLFISHLLVHLLSYHIHKSSVPPPPTLRVACR
jgi:hypothetical protein